MVKRFTILAIAAVMAACSHTPATTDTAMTTVALPTIVRAQPPAELLTPLAVSLPVFVLPGDANATSALDPLGEQAFKVLLIELTSHIKAWRAWAGTPARPP